jgi:hypothetical protein
MKVVKEYPISEHVSEFVLTLPANYQILTVFLKSNTPSPGAQPVLYVLAPEDQPETEEVTFRHVESSEKLFNAYAYVGSYQEVGYFRVKHLFRLVAREDLM